MLCGLLTPIARGTCLGYGPSSATPTINSPVRLHDARSACPDRRRESLEVRRPGLWRRDARRHRARDDQAGLSLRTRRNSLRANLRSVLKRWLALAPCPLAKPATLVVDELRPGVDPQGAAATSGTRSMRWRRMDLSPVGWSLHPLHGLAERCQISGLYRLLALARARHCLRM